MEKLSIREYDGGKVVLTIDEHFLGNKLWVRVADEEIGLTEDMLRQIISHILNVLSSR